MPAYCYLLFTVLLFDIGAPAAIIATVIFALAPAVRLTSHGIRSVSGGLIEVGEAHGATNRQVLSKVQWPVARPAILLGVNQVIMMAFGVVVIAALVGSPGLGQSVLNGLEKVNVGLALDAGLAIVLVAVILDRISTGRPLAERRAYARRSRSVKRRDLLIGLGILTVAVVFARLTHAERFPSGWTYSLRGPVNSLVDWLQANVRNGVPVIGGTSSISDFLVTRMLEPLRQLLTDTPWWIVTAAIGTLAWVTAGRRVAIISVGCLVAIGGLQFWDHSMDTLSQVIVAVLLAVVISVPVGILAGRSDRVEKLLRPFLDAAQVMPAFVYLIPVLILFNVGRVPGLVASVIYAIPVGIRLTSLGIRQVPAETVEAAVAYGATPRQVLWKVQVPLAVPTMMLGVNQVIMMSLSMVIVAGLVGCGRTRPGRGQGPHEESVRARHRPRGRDLHRAVGGRPRPHHPGLGPASPVHPGRSLTRGSTDMRRTRRLRFGLAAGVALTLIAAGCGSDSNEQQRHHGARAARAAPGRRRSGGGGRRARTCAWPSTRGPGRPSTPTSPRPSSRSEGSARSTSSTSTRTPCGPAIAKGDTLDGVLEIWPSGSRQGLRDLHHRQEGHRRRRPARPGRQDRLVRADSSWSTSTPSWRRGRASRTRSSPRCSRPPSPATRVSS